MDHIELDKDTITKAYARWAPVYDLVFGAVFERGRALRSPRPSASAAAFSRSASVPASRCRTTNAQRSCAASIFPSRCCARRTERVRARAYQRRGPLGDGRRAADISGRLVRRGGRAVRRHHGAQSGGDARRVRPRAEAGRRDHPGQPRRRRSRAAARAWRNGSRRRRASSAGAPSSPSSATPRWVDGSATACA